jgi:hypothetical protein
MALASSPIAPSQDTLLSTGGEFGWGKLSWLHTQTDPYYKLLHRTEFTTSLPPVPTDTTNSIPPSCHLLRTRTHVTFIRSKTHATRQLNMTLTAAQHTTTKQITVQYTQN